MHAFVYHLISAAELMVDYSIGSSLFLPDSLNKIAAFRFATLEVNNENWFTLSKWSIFIVLSVALI